MNKFSFANSYRTEKNSRLLLTFDALSFPLRALYNGKTVYVTKGIEKETSKIVKVVIVATFILGLSLAPMFTCGVLAVSLISLRLKIAIFDETIQGEKIRHLIEVIKKYNEAESKEALSLYYKNPEIAKWVDIRFEEESIDDILTVFSDIPIEKAISLVNKKLVSLEFQGIPKKGLYKHLEGLFPDDLASATEFILKDAAKIEEDDCPFLKLRKISFVAQLKNEWKEAPKIFEEYFLENGITPNELKNLRKSKKGTVAREIYKAFRSERKEHDPQNLFGVQWFIDNHRSFETREEFIDTVLLSPDSLNQEQLHYVIALMEEYERFFGREVAMSLINHYDDIETITAIRSRIVPSQMRIEDRQYAHIPFNKLGLVLRCMSHFPGDVIHTMDQFLAFISSDKRVLNLSKDEICEVLPLLSKEQRDIVEESCACELPFKAMSSYSIPPLFALREGTPPYIFQLDADFVLRVFTIIEKNKIDWDENQKNPQDQTLFTLWAKRKNILVMRSILKTKPSVIRQIIGPGEEILLDLIYSSSKEIGKLLVEPEDIPLTPIQQLVFQAMRGELTEEEVETLDEKEKILSIQKRYAE